MLPLLLQLAAAAADAGLNPQINAMAPAAAILIRLFIGDVNMRSSRLLIIYSMVLSMVLRKSDKFITSLMLHQNPA